MFELLMPGVGEGREADVGSGRTLRDQKSVPTLITLTGRCQERL